MSFFNSLNVSSSGLTAERLRMDIISRNIANANTTRTAAGTPYRRQIPIFQEMKSTPFSEVFDEVTGANTAKDGVEVTAIVEDQSPLKREYNPTHPDADKDGYVLLPNVDVVSEMINLISANRAYDANVTVSNGIKSMALKAMDIGR